MDASETTQKPPNRYVGVINGVWYLLDGDMKSTGTVFSVAPQVALGSPVDALSDCGNRNRKPQNDVTAGPEPCNLQGDRTISESFSRESGFPLRAGHPDLWNLLTTGTCLEGTSYPPKWWSLGMPSAESDTPW